MKLLNKRRIPEPIEKIEIRSEIKKKVLYQAVLYNEQKYSVGSCVYLKPNTFCFKSSTIQENGK